MISMHAPGARTLALLSILASGCGDPGKRPLGASCGDASECESGLCADGRCIDPAGDEDGDGVLNGVELALGTDPFDPDSDGDSVRDGSEIGSNPNLALDSDGDGVSDALESATDDADGDCIADQFDPEDRDVRHERALDVCPQLGLCATHSASLSATCAVLLDRPVWTCDPSEVPGHDTSDPTCDGVDEDCDGEVDEDFVPTLVACEPSVCSASAPTRCVGGAVESTCVTQVAATDGTCDGVDDDCDGATDDDVPDVPTACGEGACADAGALRCTDGVLLDDCAPAEAAPDDSACNGEDDDCDGETDEDAGTRAITCGEGACRSEGVVTCEDGRESVDCVALDVATEDDSSCDGIDSDCDGETDEDYRPSETGCGVGACRRSGMRTCVGGVAVDSCTPGAPGASDASCDGIDQDCNGVADEDYVVTATTCGIGACAASGQRSCVDGAPFDSCVPRVGATSDTTCDGVDDDCSGAADEDFVPYASTCGTGACTRAGTVTCGAGVPADDCTPGQPPSADDVACDGIDSNCDGSTDEGFAPTPTSCGTGACAGSGVTTCSDGRVGDSCTSGTGELRDEDCDDIDDDCDGMTDEDYLPKVTHCGVGGCARTGELQCVAGVAKDTCLPGPVAIDDDCDGVDDDCDASTDEHYATAGTLCGVGRCASQGALSCIGGAEVDSCNPSPPDCDRRQCGDDGCQGSCGTCPPPAAACLSVACSEAGQCVTSVVPRSCYIGGACIASGSVNPDNGCQYCDADADPTGWSPYKRGNPCGDDGNTCTSDTCDGAGTCTHPALPDLTACNDGDAATLGDWCVSAACGGFFTKVEAKVSPPEQTLYFEGYRRAALGPTTPSVAGSFYYTDGQGDLRGGVLHYSTGAGVLPVVLNPSSQLAALDGARIVHVDTMWEYAGSKWTNARDNGTLRLVWGSVGEEFPSTFERLVHYSASFTSYAVGAGRNNTDAGLVVRQCSVNPIQVGATWSCAGHDVFTGDYNSYPAQIVRAAGVTYIFANAGSRTAPTSTKVLTYTNNMWRAVTALGKASTSELKDVIYSGGWFIGVGSAGTLWVTKLAGYTDIALPGPTTNWLQAVVWRGNVVVVGQSGSTSTTVVLASCPIDDFLADATRWRVHTLWTGQTLSAAALAAPNDNELYVLGADRLGSAPLSPTLRAVWRYTTTATPIP